MRINSNVKKLLYDVKVAEIYFKIVFVCIVNWYFSLKN